MKSRAESLRDITGRTFDLCVIGAGATGAGCALDAQLRGLSTVLIDAGDFASATSSASTKLVHGGVRYLQQAVRDLDFGQLKVIRRALHERIHMLENAPHLAHRCEFLVPTFRRFDTLYYAFGMKLYDWMAGRAVLSKSRVLDHKAALRELPNLRPDGFSGAVTYTDGQFDDARYGVTLVETFAQAGGCIANYCKLVSFTHTAQGTLASAEAQNSLSNQSFTVNARIFINATGPFSDHIRSLANPNLAPRLALSRGVHILLPLDEAHQDSALLIPKTEDGRVLFAIPWLGRLLVGTTDDEIPTYDASAVTRAEADYLLRHLNRYLARPRQIGEIVSAFAGVRPLVRSAHTHDTKKLIRDHEVEHDPSSNLISVLGGKWTTYRAMAEDAIDHAQRLLGKPLHRSGSERHRLTGAVGFTPDYWKSLASDHGLSEPTARHLAEKYGTRSTEVLDMANADPELRVPLTPNTAAIRSEVVFSIRHEMAVTLEDVLARRIGLQFFSWKLAAEAAPDVAGLFAHELSWSESEKSRALREYLDKIARVQATLASAPALNSSTAPSYLSAQR